VQEEEVVMAETTASIVIFRAAGFLGCLTLFDRLVLDCFRDTLVVLMLADEAPSKQACSDAWQAATSKNIGVPKIHF
jgi:hypothetical protein